MISVKNEWGKLREVFVGTIDNANMPKHGEDLHAINYADKDTIPNIEQGKFDDIVYEETYEDLEKLVNTLIDCGVNVKRPKPIETQNKISNGFTNNPKSGKCGSTCHRNHHSQQPLE